MGWQIDHKHPIDDGGSDSLANLQPLQSEENREKGDQYPWKPKR
jgi:5-methylcytosine-specific restriction endonuclease McrA